MSGWKRKGHWTRWLFAAMFLGMFALAGCGVSGVGGATATPDAATILQRAQAASGQIRDATFTMKLDTSSLGTPFSGTGNGKVTTSPKRADIAFNFTVSGQQVNLEIITDAATSTGYLKFSGLSVPGFPADKWKQVPLGTAANLGADPSQFTDFGKLKNPTLVGVEQLNGTAVYHLKATLNASDLGTATAGTPTGSAVATAAAGNSFTYDLYFRQDNYQPVRIAFQSSGAAAVSAQVDFTAINSGATIDLPPADQVVGG